MIVVDLDDSFRTAELGNYIKPGEGSQMTSPNDCSDIAVLKEIHELTGRISDQRIQTILRSVIDAVALNPQPLPPRAHELLQAVVDALNPQPLPPAR
ncbi:hypothetical protein [Methylocystis sp.]|uniref:hypothetical protein n=1 Tax=Methylocystis sp. TaxID=1911079 RepID=UPI0025E63FA3|nr:hypothetical protein [Methylocystis sp.]